VAAGIGQAFNTLNGVPVVLYPLHTGTVVDGAARNHAEVPADVAARYRAGTPT
jgi:hypothetical protein